MVIYLKLDANFESCTKIKAKIAKLDLIIEALYTTALTSVQKGDTVSYTLDDGQTKISKEFTTLKSVTDAITSYETLRTMYINKLVPRMVRLFDSKNFTGNGFSNR